ncbi:phosphoglycerate mutase-like protein [Hortaea werneckii]|uniref:Phosphoglycerate mutase-like protein n=1 Tax=Hortaea werneckii TaxID=91943 RepID=A0A3M7FD70_HORWE|nr:phosphoglycerate mutase-like protein [Hortaea werneckii]KAI6991066.1 phosphoglycerate mutase-like protein [Hortaea werneckii]KAI7144155.1 phosphoglycerate mutase-like protein [Hortaea werneckii]KAI7177686.1 phosphoglycerate mutase-like protein [Hortaea werneckii]KAI7188958.1 phosphoglycerate mutase-like protein [Hortaea werneckii]
MPSANSLLLTAAAAALPAAWAQTNSDETILGVYMFHRHGDRTAKATAPANLTTLGYREVYTSGSYYRNRYVASSAPFQISGINSDLVKQSQISVLSPADDVLENSALGFLQGLYPPVGDSMGTTELGNGSSVAAPLDGYQLIPIGLVDTGSGSEDSSWLQSAQGCAKATSSSNNYFLSQQYQDLLASTQDFYEQFEPVVNGSFDESELNFKNAYTIYDLINVARIHNSSFDPSDIVTDDRFFQLRTLADSQQWGLAYNSSDDMRAVAGMTLAAEILEFLNETIENQGQSKIGVQFGSYGTFMSFFGLAQLEKANPDFKGVPDYASAMSFELFTNQTLPSGTWPDEEDIYVRFLFHNGTTSNTSEPTVYPLFNSGQDTITWDQFASGMHEFALGSTEKWCTACGNFTGECAAYDPSCSSSSSDSQNASASAQTGNGLSPAVNGVIGAMITLAVVLGLEALVMLLGGFRLVRKNSLGQSFGGEGVEKVGQGVGKAA